MKRLSLVVVALCALAAVAEAQHPIAFEDLAAIKRIGAPQLSPDGKWVAYDLTTVDLDANASRSAIQLMPADGAGSPKALTDGTKKDASPAWSPDGKKIAFTSNRDGSSQLWLVDVATGALSKATSLAGGVSSFKWMPDGSGFVVVSDIHPDCGVDPKCAEEKSAAAAKKPSKAKVIDSLLYRHWTAWQAETRTHILHVALDGSQARDLTPGAFDAPPFSVGGGDEFDISPDGGELVFARNSEKNPELSTNSDLYLVPLRGTGEVKKLTTREGADTAPVYSPDGRWIAWHSQSRNGFESDQWELWLHDRKAGTSKRIAADFPNWIESLAWSPDSRSLLVTAPIDGRNAIYEITLDGRAIQVFKGGNPASIDFAPDGKTIFFSMSSLSRPADIYALQRGGQPRRLTRENDALLARLALSSVEDLRWKGADGAMIQGHLIKPPMFDASRKYPAIVLIHGGPQGAWGDAWSYRWNPQMWAARGYVILMPNPRGSSGFGQQFVEEISKDWAGKVYVDLMNGVDQFAALPYVDASRIGAAGASYGGYMINWILGHSNRFKALVSHAGVYNLESMYGVTEEIWFPEWEFGGAPWDQPEVYERLSPHKYVKNFATPTLVSHGELDFRVPIDQGLQLFTALQRRGVPSRLLYFPDEGHWVLKPQNSKLWHAQVLDWMDRWLKP